MLEAAGCSDSESPSNSDMDSDPPVVTAVTAIDMGHIEVAFDEAVDKNSAERRSHYTIVEQAVLKLNQSDVSPDDTLDVGAAVLEAGGTKVMLTLWDVLHDAPYNIYVGGIKDVHGNEMAGSQSRAFNGTVAEDDTPPELIARSPSAGQTGVGLSQSVAVQFTEQLDEFTLYSGFYWTGGGGNVDFTLDQMDNNTYLFSPAHNLALNTMYTVGFASNTVIDWGGNYLAATSWTFRTTNVTDLLPPTITSTYPANGATNVPLDANLSIEFSEAIDPTSMENQGVLIYPNPGDGVPGWSNGNRKLTFDPDDPLLAGTTYSMVIPPGAVKDLAGNPLADGETVIFSTGSSLPMGSFSGTVAGDATSPDAMNPAGAIVVAFLVSIDDFDDYDDGPPQGGTGIVNASGVYTISNLADAVYFPMGILDSNGDGFVDPELGDAVGVYGVDFLQADLEVDSVAISGGSAVGDIDFQLFDPVAIAGTVTYGGTIHAGELAYYQYYVGAFSVATFDTSQGIPESDFSTNGRMIAEEPNYVLSQFNDRMEPGSWYIGGFMDVNYNFDYDPDIDPAGFYMNGGDFGEVTVTDGHDELAIDIILLDPAAGASPSAGSWRMEPGRESKSPGEGRLLSPARAAALKQALRRLK